MNGVDAPKQLAQMFEAYLRQFQDQKKVEISRSIDALPFRMQKLSLNLATSSSAQNSAQGRAGGRWLEFNVPFNAIHVERIYSTSTDADKSGSIELIFDADNILFANNPKTLFANDSFITKDTIGKFYLGWDAQADTTIDIIFFIDIDYKAGSTKTEIVGTVSVAPSRIAVPSLTDTRRCTGAAGSFTYTVPSGKIAKLSASAGVSGAGFAAVYINTGAGITELALAQSAGAGTNDTVTSVGCVCLAGTVVTGATNAAGAFASVHIEEYDV